jgi:flagellar hook-length control protein FliK
LAVRETTEEKMVDPAPAKRTASLHRSSSQNAAPGEPEKSGSKEKENPLITDDQDNKNSPSDLQAVSATVGSKDALSLQKKNTNGQAFDQAELGGVDGEKGGSSRPSDPMIPRLVPTQEPQTNPNNLYALWIGNPIEGKDGQPDFSAPMAVILAGADEASVKGDTLKSLNGGDLLNGKGVQTLQGPLSGEGMGNLRLHEEGSTEKFGSIELSALLSAFLAGANDQTVKEDLLKNLSGGDLLNGKGMQAIQRSLSEEGMGNLRLDEEGSTEKFGSIELSALLSAFLAGANDQTIKGDSPKILNIDELIKGKGVRTILNVPPSETTPETHAFQSSSKETQGPVLNLKVDEPESARAMEKLADASKLPSEGTLKIAPIPLEPLKAGQNSAHLLEKEKSGFSDSSGAGIVNGGIKEEGQNKGIGKSVPLPQAHLFSTGDGTEQSQPGTKEGEESLLNNSLLPLKNPTLIKIREEIKSALDRQTNFLDPASKPGWNSPEQQGEKPPVNAPTASAAPGIGLAVEKTAIFRPQSFGHAPAALALGLSADQTFVLKKYSPSSLEVSLEPEGLGTLNVELKIVNHHLNAQITVNDFQGKELLEKNLPQLLADLNKGGLQIGEFSVSLRNQGRDPQADFIEHPASRGQPTAPLEAAARPVRSDNHLIHIII